MPRFKEYNQRQTVLLPISFDRQILPGTFEYTLNYLVDERLDLSIFHHRYNNTETGRPAYDPALLLKIVLLAYSRGVTGSRRIEALCRENVLFMALSADTQPHFTTIADFISASADEIAKLFKQILLICDEMGLIGKEMFAIDGCKLPSNASKEWSGTKDRLKKKSRKIDRAVRHMLNKHRDEDQQGENDTSIRKREEKQIETLLKVSDKIDRFLEENDERLGYSGKEVQSNITDNESAKMKTSNGVIQGYVGVSAVDSKHQVVVSAEAFGQGQEHGLLEPMVESIEEAFAEDEQSPLQDGKVLADSGFCNKTTLTYLEEKNIDGYVADHGFRSRDPRFQTAGAYKSAAPKKASSKSRFTAEDFSIDIDQQSCICPAGKRLWLKCARAKIDNNIFMQFMGHKEDCEHCSLRAKCLRSIKQQGARQVNVKIGSIEVAKTGPLERMKQKIDSTLGRHIYSMRLGIVEPVFGHINDAIGIKRFTLRGKEKVNGQWQLMNMLHNMTKIHRFGMV
ncbi:MAG: IS1182 family transposase [Desulfobulbaceae bacterium]|nr:IS1182 family transposase [Desulfobulbaceae bacterium]